MVLLDYIKNKIMKLSNKNKTSIALILCAFAGFLIHPANQFIVNLCALIPCIIACIIIEPLIKNKFDIYTLVPFESRILIRDYNDKIWVPAFWGKLLEEDSNCKYLTSCGCYKYCIPYEGNEHLLGTTNDCDEYYKTW